MVLSSYNGKLMEKEQRDKNTELDRVTCMWIA